MSLDDLFEPVQSVGVPLEARHTEKGTLRRVGAKPGIEVAAARALPGNALDDDDVHMALLLVGEFLLHRNGSNE